MWDSETSRKSIYVVGPSSTGKSTLCAALAKRLNLQGPAHVTEVARHIMENQGYTRKDVGLLKMQEVIMGAHLKREEEGRSCAIQVCDRSAVDPIVYAVMTSINDNEAQRRRNILVNSADFQRALKSYKRSIFILLTPVEDWLVDDGVRHTQDQARCLDIFRKILSELGLCYSEFGADMRFLEERVTVVMGLARL